LPDLADINFAAMLIDGTTLVIPSSVTAHTRDGSLVITRGELDAAQNPPQYRLSCWRQMVAVDAPQGVPNTDGAAAAGPQAAVSGLVDLNHATVSELETLPGIGPKLAGRIVEYRMRAPFHTVDDVANVSGIGPKRLEAIRPFVTVHASD
jgi:competence protein ComEA